MQELWEVLMRMLASICEEEQCECLPALVLDRRKPSQQKATLKPISPSSSCGATSFPVDHPPTIELQVGRDPLDLVLVFLHEVAHVLVPPTVDALGRVRAHTMRFFVQAGRLYRQWGIPLGYAVWRETQFAPSAARSIIRGYFSAV